MIEFERYLIDDRGRIFLKNQPKVQIGYRRHKISLFVHGVSVYMERSRFLFEYVWKEPMNGNYLLHLDGDRHNYSRNNLVWITVPSPTRVIPAGAVMIGDMTYPTLDVASYLTGIPVGEIINNINTHQPGYRRCAGTGSPTSRGIKGVSP